MKNLYLFLIILALFSCDIEDNNRPPIDDDMGPDCPSYESNHLNIMWQSSLHEDTISCFSMIPTLTEDGVMFSDRFSGDNKESITNFDKSTGNIEWYWDGIERSGAIVGRIVENHFIDSDFIFTMGKELISLNSDSGSPSWQKDVENSGPRINVIGEFVYYIKNNFSGSAIFRSDMVQVDPATQSENIIFSKSVENNYEPRLEIPVLYVNDMGESILIFQNASWNFESGINQGKIDLYAFNLSKQKIEWLVEDLTPEKNASVNPPIVHKGRVFFQGANSIHCLDAETGEGIWFQQIVGESFFQGKGLVIDDRWILNGDSDHIYAFDIETGDLLWDNPFTGSTVPNMDHYNGIIYFGSKGDGKLRGVRASDGMLILEANSPNEICDSGASYSSGVVIDQDTGYLYIHDKFFAMGIDLN